MLKTYMDCIYTPFHFVANSKGGLLANIWFLIKSLMQCEGIYRTNKQIEIVHIHTASYNSFKRSVLYIKQAKRYGKKVVCHIHGGGFRDFRKTCPEFVDKHLNMCDAVVALSETWRKYFAEELELNNVYVINNIIENPKIMQVENDGRFHILFLGLITEVKGIFDLLDVLRDNKEVWNGHIILHVGGNGKVDEFKQKIVEYGIENMVVYEGWVSGDKKVSLFNIANAFILPSYTEGVPISILEAMSYGIPILSTLVGGIPEVVNTDTGILFTPRDKTMMAKAITKIFSDVELCHSMKSNCKKEANAYLPNSIAMQLKNLYDQL